MSDFKSSKNDIPLVWYDHYHLGKTEHVGKTEFSSQKTAKEMNFSFCLTWRALEGVQYVHENTKNEVCFIEFRDETFVLGIGNCLRPNRLHLVI